MTDMYRRTIVDRMCAVPVRLVHPPRDYAGVTGTPLRCASDHARREPSRAVDHSRRVPSITSGYTDAMSDQNDLRSLVRVDRKNAPRAAESLARAFVDYELIRHYFPDDARAFEISRLFLSLGVSGGIRLGVVYGSSPAMEGVAVWIPPGGFPVPPMKLFASVPLIPLIRFMAKGGSAMREAGDHLDRRHKALMPRPHWYLEILGVDPIYQGQGHSARLVRAMFSRADADGVPIYVDTVGNGAIGVYRHLGFTVLEESVIPDTALPYWCLARHPAG